MTNSAWENSGVTLSVLKELQETNRVNASKALGQNFLVDPNISNKIAQTIKSDMNVIEIGPGIGSLTVPLAQHSQQVFAIELDQHILDPLSQVLDRFGVTDKVKVINQDVMKTDLQQLCNDENVETIIGNLPYNISAPLLADISMHVPKAKKIVAMVQKEVGQRLAAEQGTREVSAITLKIQYFMDVSILFSVPSQSFIPRPRVDSVVIEMNRTNRTTIKISEDKVQDLFRVIDQAFSQRRKMLRKSLASVLGGDSDNVFAMANLDPTLRPEQCTLEDFARLFEVIQGRS